MRERDIFIEALQQPPVSRSAFVEEACNGDSALRERVQSLLGLQSEARSFLEPAPIATILSHEITERPGTQIGPYKLLEQIGEGGFGVVFMAEQIAPVKRKVALKVVKPGMDTRQVIARFEAERQALALMDHPNIARILDAGTTGEVGPVCQTGPGALGVNAGPGPARQAGPTGRPYFVMELVKGIPITDYCDQQRLSTRDRLKLFVDVCHAVQHAHQKGIIHRDLKPTNVLVTQHDGKPLAKVIDFGIAKALGQQLTDKTLFTGFAQLIGTPLYMSPEQAALSDADVDTRSDVYSLGVMLYELLTGTTPFDKESLSNASYDELRRIIREDEPPRPSARISTLAVDTRSTIASRQQLESQTLGHQLRGELDWIVMRALEKDRNRRYESAGALAADVDRYLRDEPVTACPPSAWYRMQKFARRRKGLITTIALVGLAVLVGTAVSVWQAIAATSARKLADERLGLANQRLQRETEARGLAERERRKADEIAYAQSIRLAAIAIQYDFDVRAGRKLLTAAAALGGQHDLCGLEWHYLDSLIRAESREVGSPLENLTCVAVSSDGQLLAAGGEAGIVLVIEMVSGNTMRTLTTSHGHARSVAFNRAGDRLAVCGDDGTVSVWDARRGELLAAMPSCPTELRSVCWILNDEWIATAGALAEVRLWHAGGGGETAAIGTNSAGVTALCASADGKRLAAGTAYGHVWIWDAETREVQYRFRHQDLKITCLAFSHDGQCVAVGNNNMCVRVYRPGRQGAVREFEVLCMDQVRSLAFSPGDRQLAILEHLGTLQVFDLSLQSTGPLEKRTLVRAWLADERRGTQLAWLPDGDGLVSVGFAGVRPRIWKRPQTSDCRLSPLPDGVEHSLESLRFARGGDWLITGGYAVRAWTVEGARPARDFASALPDVKRLAVSPEGGRLAVASSSEPTLEVWDLPGDAPVPLWRASAVPPEALALSVGGRLLAALDWTNNVVVLHDGTSGEVLGTFPARSGHNVAFSPDGRLLAVDDLNDVVVWDVSSRSPAARLTGHDLTIQAVAFSADGRWLASAGQDRDIRLWSTADWRLIHAMHGHRTPVEQLQFTSDSRTLVSSATPGWIKLWHVASGHELCDVRFPAKGIGWRFALAPDDRTLAVWNHDGAVEIRRLRDD